MNLGPFREAEFVTNVVVGGGGPVLVVAPGGCPAALRWSLAAAFMVLPAANWRRGSLDRLRDVAVIDHRAHMSRGRR
jgi:hypothetical protein